MPSVEMQAGWVIESWSRELGRGTVRSETGTLPFDAAVGEVDDFVVGGGALIPKYRLAFHETRYVELAPRWETRLVRPSTKEEKSYLASKFDWDEPLVAVT